MIEFRQFERFGNRVQLVIFQIRQQCAGKRQRIQRGKRERDGAPFEPHAQEGSIERGVVRRQNRIFTTENKKRPERFFLARSVCHHFIGDSGQLGDFFWDGLFRIAEGVEFVQNFTVPHTDRSDLGNPLGGSAQSRCFKVKDNIFAFQRNIGGIGHNRNQIVDKIGLHTVNYFDIAALLADIGCGAHRIGKCLRDAVVSDCDGGMSPLIGALDQCLCRSERVVCGHIGVQMKLHAFLRGFVNHLQLLHAVNIVQLNGIVLVICIERILPVDQQRISCGKFLKRMGFFLFRNRFKRNGVGVIGNGNSDDDTPAVPGILHLAGEHVAPDGHLRIFLAQIIDRLWLGVDQLTDDRLRRGHHDLRFEALGPNLDFGNIHTLDRCRLLLFLLMQHHCLRNCRSPVFLSTFFLLRKVLGIVGLHIEHAVEFYRNGFAVPFPDQLFQLFIKAARADHRVAAVLQCNDQPAVFHPCGSIPQRAVDADMACRKLLHQLRKTFRTETFRRILGPHLYLTQSQFGACKHFLQL